MKDSNFVFAMFLILLASLLATGCIGNNKPKMEYNVRYCEGGGPAQDAGFRLEKSGDNIVLWQKENYVCCANISITMKASNRTIEIYEDNVGEYCRCICPFEAEIKLENTEGFDSVRVYGIRYKDVYDYELMYEWPEKQGQ